LFESEASNSCRQGYHPSQSRTVLFLCTGNYYRSRHAEHVFNFKVKKCGLGWQAASRGLALELGANNVGPISGATVDRLICLGIPWDAEPPRLPASVTEEDLAGAGLIVALKEAEHRPLMSKRFPMWVERVEYWSVHDVDFALPSVALPQIEEAVENLIARLVKGNVG
jgi:protein-tyrosine phosphatase